MTLVVARKFFNRVIVFSDTMISGQGLERSSIIPGRLKSVIIADHISISFAGNADAAISTIRKAHRLYKECHDLDRVIHLLVEATQDGACDFIVVSHLGPILLLRISEGKIARGADVYWLGDPGPLNDLFEMERQQQVPDNRDEEFGSADEVRYRSAILQLYMKRGTQIAQGIGGFFIDQLCSPLGYCYQGNSGSIIRDTCTIPGGWSARQLDDQASGMTRYGYNIITSRYRGVSVVGAFLADAQVGYVYSPLEQDKAEKIFPATLEQTWRAVQIRAQRLGGWMESQDGRLKWTRKSK